MNRQRGLTLIELMVAVLITGIVAYFAFDLLGGEGKHYTKTRNKVRLQADAREALRVIADDLKNVGYSRGLRLTSLTGESNTDRFGARLDLCDDLLPSEKRVEILDNAAGEQDQFTIRFYEPDLATGTTVRCRDNTGNAVAPSEISYSFSKSSGAEFGQLIRSYKPAGAANASTSTLLRDVVVFQVQQGQDPALDPALPVYVYGGNPDLSSASGWSGDFALTAHASSGKQAAMLDLENWSTSTKSVLSPSITLPKRQFLKVTYTLKVDPTFAVAYNAEPAKSVLQAGLVYNGNWLTGAVQTVSIPNITAFPAEYTFSFLRETGWDADTQVQFKVQGNTSQASPTAKISLENLHVQVLRNLQVDASTYLWKDGTAATSAPASRQIGAVRIWLLARSPKSNQEGSQQTFVNLGNWQPSLGAGWMPPADKKTYALSETIIQVLNNDR